MFLGSETLGSDRKVRSDSAQEGAILVGPAPLADCGRCEETRVALSPQCWPAVRVSGPPSPVLWCLGRSTGSVLVELGLEQGEVPSLLQVLREALGHQIQAKG